MATTTQAATGRRVLHCGNCGATLGVKADTTRDVVECPRYSWSVPVPPAGGIPAVELAPHPKPSRPTAEQIQAAFENEVFWSVAGWAFLLVVLVPALSVFFVPASFWSIFFTGLVTLVVTVPLSHHLAERSRGVRAIGWVVSFALYAVLVVVSVVLDVLGFILQVLAVLG